jgi:hypothetical protein
MHPAHLRTIRFTSRVVGSLARGDGIHVHAVAWSSPNTFLSQELKGFF